MLSKVEWFFKYLFIHCGFTLPTLLWFRFKVQEFKQKGSSTVLNQVNWTESFNCVRNQAGGTWGEDVLEQHYKVKLCDDGRLYEHRCYAEGSRCIKYILQTLRCFYEGFEDRVTLSVILMLVTFLSLGLLTLGQLFTCSLKHEAEATEIWTRGSWGFFVLSINKHCI